MSSIFDILLHKRVLFFFDKLFYLNFRNIHPLIWKIIHWILHLDFLSFFMTLVIHTDYWKYKILIKAANLNSGLAAILDFSKLSPFYVFMPLKYKLRRTILSKKKLGPQKNYFKVKSQNLIKVRPLSNYFKILVVRNLAHE